VRALGRRRRCRSDHSEEPRAGLFSFLRTAGICISCAEGMATETRCACLCLLPEGPKPSLVPAPLVSSWFRVLRTVLSCTMTTESTRMTSLEAPPQSRHRGRLSSGGIFPNRGSRIVARPWPLRAGRRRIILTLVRPGSDLNAIGRCSFSSRRTRALATSTSKA